MLLDDIGDYLSSGGLGTLGTDMFLSTLPDEPDTVISIFETGGSSPMHTMGANPPLAEFPSFQVICRARRYDDARVLAKDADILLNGVRNRLINGVMYRWIMAQQSPFFISRDEQNREEIGCNYSVVRDSATSS